MGWFIFSKPNIEKMKRERDVEGLIKALRNDHVGESAALAIRDIGDERVVEPLIKMLGDKKPLVRNRAALALLGLADKRAVWPLINMLKEHWKNNLTTPPDDMIVSGFVEIGEPAVEPLITVIEDDSIHSSYPTELAAKALSKIGDHRAVGPLIKVIERFESWGEEDVGVDALKEIKDRRAVEPLINALNHQNNFVREAAAVALGRIGDSRAVESLMGALKDEYRDVRLKAGEALRGMGIDMPNTKIFPLLVCAECKKLFYYDPGKPVYCPDHPQAELKVSEYPELPRIDKLSVMSTKVMFFEGCGVVGIGLPSGPKEMCGLSEISPDTFCKLSYDKNTGCWMWVEKLPQERKEGVITEITTKEEEKHEYPSVDLVKCPYYDHIILYKPGKPVGLPDTIYDPFGYHDLRYPRVKSCPFHPIDYIEVLFHPDGRVGLKVTEDSVKFGLPYRLYDAETIIGEVFSIVYDAEKGWMWV